MLLERREILRLGGVDKNQAASDQHGCAQQRPELAFAFGRAGLAFEISAAGNGGIPTPGDGHLFIALRFERRLFELDLLQLLEIVADVRETDQRLV